MRKQGKFDKAVECIRGAKEKLFSAAPSYDRSAVLHEEILLKMICGYNETVALNRQEIESIYDLVLAGAITNYEYQALCMVLIAKAEFHLRSIYKVIKTFENVTGCRDIRTAKSKETR